MEFESLLYWPQKDNLLRYSPYGISKNVDISKQFMVTKNVVGIGNPIRFSFYALVVMYKKI